MDLVEELYLLTNSFPRTELYIAEGQGRESIREFARFLSIAHGSLTELETQVLLSIRLGYTTEDRIERIMGLIDEIGRMLRTLVRKYRQEEPTNMNKRQNTSDSRLMSSDSIRKDLQ